MRTSKQYRKARSVLQSLIQGLDPETSAELPKDAIVNRIEINRSMLIAVTAMKQVEARMLRRAQLPERKKRSISKTSLRAPNGFRSSQRNTSEPFGRLRLAWNGWGCWGPISVRPTTLS